MKVNTNYMYENNFKDIYVADIGSIAELIDKKSKYNNKLVYISGGTFNEYCYKDYNIFKNNPDKICYIAESRFDKEPLLVDYVNKNKDRLIKEGGFSTANSIKEEVRNELKYEEYFYEYEKNGKVYTIEANDFDEKLIEEIAADVFDIVDWQSTQSFICERDWGDCIADYYDEKLQKGDLEV